MARAQIYVGTTMLVRLDELTRNDTGARVLSGVAVTAALYDPASRDELSPTPIVEVTLSHVANGLWQGIADAVAGIAAGEHVDVKWVADGGESFRSTWWERGVRVLERYPEG